MEECLSITDTIFLSSETDLVNGLFFYYSKIIIKKSKKDIETIKSVYLRLLNNIQWKNVAVQDLIESDAKSLVTLKMMTETTKQSNRLYFDKELLDYFTSQHINYNEYFILHKLYDNENMCQLSVNEIKVIQNFKFQSLLNNNNLKIRNDSENACIYIYLYYILLYR